MFSKTKSSPVKIGSITIEESKEGVLLGFTITKNLTWTSHLEKLEKDLRKRIGMLRVAAKKLPSYLRETGKHTLPSSTSCHSKALPLFDLCCEPWIFLHCF